MPDDEARLTCYLVLIDVRGPAIVSTGGYHDVVRREDGRWRFAHRHFELDDERTRLDSPR